GLTRRFTTIADPCGAVLPDVRISSGRVSILIAVFPRYSVPARRTICRQRQEQTMYRLTRMILGTLLIVLSTVPYAADRPIPTSVDKQLTRAQALKAVDHSQTDVRLQAIERLAEDGTMADANKLAPRLHDESENVRELAAAAL